MLDRSSSPFPQFFEKTASSGGVKPGSSWCVIAGIVVLLAIATAPARAAPEEPRSPAEYDVASAMEVLAENAAYAYYGGQPLRCALCVDIARRLLSAYGTPAGAQEAVQQLLNFGNHSFVARNITPSITGEILTRHEVRWKQLKGRIPAQLSGAWRGDLLADAAVISLTAPSHQDIRFDQTGPGLLHVGLLPGDQLVDTIAAVLQDPGRALETVAAGAAGTAAGLLAGHAGNAIVASATGRLAEVLRRLKIGRQLDEIPAPGGTGGTPPAPSYVPASRQLPARGGELGQIHPSEVIGKTPQEIEARACSWDSSPEDRIR
jgi:hypothetical protein